MPAAERQAVELSIGVPAVVSWLATGHGPAAAFTAAVHRPGPFPRCPGRSPLPRDARIP